MAVAGAKAAKAKKELPELAGASEGDIQQLPIYIHIYTHTYIHRYVCIYIYISNMVFLFMGPIVTSRYFRPKDLYRVVKCSCPQDLVIQAPLCNTFRTGLRLVLLGRTWRPKWEFPKIRGTLIWGPYNKDPTI